MLIIATVVFFIIALVSGREVVAQIRDINLIKRFGNPKYIQLNIAAKRREVRLVVIMTIVFTILTLLTLSLII